MLLKVPFSFYFLKCGYRNSYLFLDAQALVAGPGLSPVAASERGSLLAGSARASHCSAFYCRRAQALGKRAL